MRLSKLFDPLTLTAYIRKRGFERRFRKTGKNFIYDPLSTIITPELMEVGDNVFIGEQAHISGRLTIGNNVMFGPRPIIVGGNHLFAVGGKSVRFLAPLDGENIEPVAVEDEVWCGASVLLLGGVTLGMGCVIGAGSVVTKSIPPYVIAVGNPCKPVARIFGDASLVRHLEQLGYEDIARTILRRRTAGLRSMNIRSIKTVDHSEQYRR